jgi:hypothetical protein
MKKLLSLIILGLLLSGNAFSLNLDRVKSEQNFFTLREK